MAGRTMACLLLPLKTGLLAYKTFSMIVSLKTMETAGLIVVVSKATPSDRVTLKLLSSMKVLLRITQV